FDVKKDKAKEVLSAAEKALQDLATGFDLEDAQEADDDSEEDEDDDNLEGWVNELEELEEEERQTLQEQMVPVKLIRKLSFAIINSSTKLLPSWERLLLSLKLEMKRLPRDVATRWNSTFKMLNCALKYRVAVDAFTGDRRMDVRECELNEFEWEIATQLRDVLKVRASC
ncbi:hypothetical protein K474DRAFT_1601981, partial [Panus rudis PR-1116 ss-1]